MVNSYQSSFSKARLVGFSDGVFAIAVTLLVLDIAIPESDSHLLAALVHLWPDYLAYVVSFSTIGAAWFAHTTITEHLERADGIFMRINLMFLMLVSFLPFPTKVLANTVIAAGGERVAVTLYGVVILGVSGMLLVLWRYATRHNLLEPDLGGHDVKRLARRLSRSLLAYAFLLVLGWFVPVAAVTGFLLIAGYLLFPKLPRRRGHDNG